MGKLASETSTLWAAANSPNGQTLAVIICEGEKSADAATRLLPGFVAVTSPNGSKSAGNADWSPLRGARDHLA